MQPFPSLLPLPTLSPRWLEVPQRAFVHRIGQRNFEPSEPILFSVYGFPGINIEDALHKRFTGLDGRDDPMFQNRVSGAILCRFLV